MATFEMTASLVKTEMRKGENGEFLEVTLNEQLFSPTTGEIYSDYNFNALCFKEEAVQALDKCNAGDKLFIEGRLASKTKTLDDGRVFHSSWLKISKLKNLSTK